MGRDILGSTTIQVKAPRDSTGPTSRARHQPPKLGYTGLAVADRRAPWAEPGAERSWVIPNPMPTPAGQVPLKPDILGQFYTTTQGGH